MPMTYDTPQTIEEPKAVSEIHCVGLNIRLPRGGEATVTYYFEAVDADGNVIDHRPLTIPIAQIAVEKPDMYSDVYGQLKKDAYERAQVIYPKGGVV